MRYRCHNCPSRFVGGLRCYHEFDADEPACDKCGSVTAVFEIESVHFLIPDPAGPIFSQKGRYRLACEPRREVLALPGEDYHATAEARAVTCPSCMGVEEWRQTAGRDPVMREKLRAIREGRDCC
jgi:hypothetical protein